MLTFDLKRKIYVKIFLHRYESNRIARFVLTIFKSLGLLISRWEWNCGFISSVRRTV